MLGFRVRRSDPTRNQESLQPQIFAVRYEAGEGPLSLIQAVALGSARAKHSERNNITRRNAGTRSPCALSKLSLEANRSGPRNRSVNSRDGFAKRLAAS